MSLETSSVPLEQLLSQYEGSSSSSILGDRVFEPIMTMLLDERLTVEDELLVMAELVNGMNRIGEISPKQAEGINNAILACIPPGNTSNPEFVQATTNDIVGLFLHPELSKHYRNGFLLNIPLRLQTEGKLSQKDSTMIFDEVAFYLEIPAVL